MVARKYQLMGFAVIKMVVSFTIARTESSESRLPRTSFLDFTTIKYLIWLEIDVDVFSPPLKLLTNCSHAYVTFPPFLLRNERCVHDLILILFSTGYNLLFAISAMQKKDVIVNLDAAVE